MMTHAALHLIISGAKSRGDQSNTITRILKSAGTPPDSGWMTWEIGRDAQGFKLEAATETGPEGPDGRAGGIRTHDSFPGIEKSMSCAFYLKVGTEETYKDQ